MPREYPNPEENLVDAAKSLAHSLNNILSIVLTNSQLAMEDISASNNKPCQEILDYLKDIATATADGGLLIHQFQRYLDSLADGSPQHDTESLTVLPDNQVNYITENSDIKPQPDLQDPPLNEVYEDMHSISSGVRQVSILIIDDEDKIRHALSYALTLAGHHVITTSNGKEGISIFQDGSYDLVFVDLKMPEIDGWKVLKAVKNIDPDVITVVMTGWRIRLDDKRLKDNGVNAVITKPFDLSAINQILSTVVNKNFQPGVLWNVDLNLC